IAMMRQTDPDNVNLPYMLQSLASWIISSEKQKKNESRLAEAESLILESRLLFIRHYGEDHGSTLTVDVQLATLAGIRGDLTRAENIKHEYLRRLREVGAQKSSQIMAMVSLAETKIALGKVAEGESLISEALAMGRRE
ncbi:MAG TPA: hypothetical protein VMS31_22850, partial [Pyrinomonadaceae bacterium]|nr:hypothetical protein [Pyrinomonadaceae bacterium]